MLSSKLEDDGIVRVIVIISSCSSLLAVVVMERGISPKLSRPRRPPSCFRREAVTIGGLLLGDECWMRALLVVALLQVADPRARA